ncbi:MAG TPA: UDP-N-acetylmuramate--L-alanine ligase [Patescibacteria group bacterium]|nr:UDP-N-acetylmuramate--L-alanine ligase [Patescibacteria group bacterium]
MQSFYFLGIAGTAMGSVAAALAKLGYTVYGADHQVYPPMSDYLKENGIVYTEGYSPDDIIKTQPDVIVVGNAIARGNPALEYALNEHMTLIAMPEIIRTYLIGRNTSVVIAGTHGKTTTASLTAWLFESAGLEPGYLIGGVPRNFTQSCRAVPEHRNNTKSGFFVSEGDEYDSAFFDKRSKFLHYSPDIAVINNIEFDHADIFHSLEDVKRTFRHFARIIPQNGVLLIAADEENSHNVAEGVPTKVETFGISSAADWRAVDIRYTPTGTDFLLKREEQIIGEFHLPMAGEHNLKNAVAAIACALHAGADVELLKVGLPKYLPPKRRMEVLKETNGITLIDDFGHHPTAIRETLAAIKQNYPGRRIVACFEPRSNTTTRNIFQKDLEDCFTDAEVVMIGALNRPERYSDSERLDTEAIARHVRRSGKVAYAVPVQHGRGNEWGELIGECLLKTVENGDVVVMLSNGDFGGLREILPKILDERASVLL